MTDKKDTTRRWGYRKTDDGVESKIFEGPLPKGWKDTPAGMTDDDGK